MKAFITVHDDDGTPMRVNLAHVVVAVRGSLGEVAPSEGIAGTVGPCLHFRLAGIPDTFRVVRPLEIRAMLRALDAFDAVGVER